MAGEFNAGAIVSELQLSGGDSFVGGLKKAFQETSGFTKGLLAAGAAAIGTSAAIAVLVQESADYIDKIGKQAQMIGMTTEELSSYALVAKLSDITTEEFGQSVSLLSKKMTEAASGSESANAAFQALGISVKDSHGKMKASTDVLEEIADKFASTKDGAEKTAAALDLMGRAGTKMIPLLDGGAEEIRKIREEAEAMGLVFSKSAFDAAQRFNDSQTRIQQSLVGLRNKISETIIAMINQTGIFEKAAAIVQKVTGWWNSLTEGQRQFIVKSGALILAVVATTAAVAGLVVVVNFLTAAMLANPIGLVIVGVVALTAAVIALGIWLSDVIDKVSDTKKVIIMTSAAVLAPMVAVVAAAALIYKHWDSITAHVSAFWQTTKPIFEKLADFLLTPFTKFSKVARETFEAVQNYIKGLFRDTGVEGVIDKIMNFLNSAKGIAEKFEIPDMTRLLISNVIGPFMAMKDKISFIFTDVIPFIYDEMMLRMKTRTKDVGDTISALLRNAFDITSFKTADDVMKEMAANGKGITAEFSKTFSETIQDKFGSQWEDLTAAAKARTDALLKNYDENLKREREQNKQAQQEDAKENAEQIGSIRPPAVHVPVKFDFENFAATNLSQALFSGFNLRSDSLPMRGILDAMDQTSEFVKQKHQVMQEAIAQGAKDGGKQAGENFRSAYASAAGKAMTDVMNGIINGYQNILTQTANLLAIQQQNLVTNTDFALKGVEHMMQQYLDALTRELDAQIKALEDQKEAMLDEERKYQDKLKAMRDGYASDRQQELDEELRAEFDRLQEKYRQEVEFFEDAGLSEIDLDAKKQDALAELEKKKNQLISESKKKLADDISNNNARLDKEASVSANYAQQREQQLADRIKQLEKEKAAAVEESNNKRMKLEQQLKMYQWLAGFKAFEAEKRAKVQQAEVSMLMGQASAAEAGASVAASIGGWYGLIAGIAAAAVLSTMNWYAGTRAMQAASAAQYPPPPVFAEGGMATMPSIFGESGRFGSIGSMYGTELAIPANNPGKDFGALKAEVAKELVGGKKGVGDVYMNVYNNFSARDDYETIKMKLNQDFRDMIRSAVAS